MKIKTVNVALDPKAKLPEKAHDTDAGYDLYATRTGIVPPKGSAVFDTGVHIAIPFGYCGLICARSGLNIKEGILSTGVVDCAYTGSVRVKLYNMTETPYFVREGDRISQLLLVPVASPTLIAVSSLEETERGENGFGSSGR